MAEHIDRQRDDIETPLDLNADIETNLGSPSGSGPRIPGRDAEEYRADKRWRVPRKSYEQGAALDDDDEVLRELEEKREQPGNF
jgi:hypothetical protein